MLDLDETLSTCEVSTTNTVKPINISFTIDNSRHSYNLHPRPGVEDFIKEMSKDYELVLFTAGIKEVRV